MKKELEKISKELQKREGQSLPKKLKKEVAKICLEMINETRENKVAIQETAYIITGYFILYSFDDELDEAISIAGNLELPEEHASGDVFKLWKKMKNIFENYLKLSF